MPRKLRLDPDPRFLRGSIQSIHSRDKSFWIHAETDPKHAFESSCLQINVLHFNPTYKK
jgi:hypothetical protein